MGTLRFEVRKLTGPNSDDPTFNPPSVALLAPQRESLWLTDISQVNQPSGPGTQNDFGQSVSVQIGGSGMEQIAGFGRGGHPNGMHVE
jgi:hypothetical protein